MKIVFKVQQDTNAKLITHSMTAPCPQIGRPETHTSDINVVSLKSLLQMRSCVPPSIMPMEFFQQLLANHGLLLLLPL